MMVLSKQLIDLRACLFVMTEEIKDRLHESGIAAIKGAVGAGAVALTAINPALGLLAPVVSEFIFTGLPSRKLDRVTRMLDQARSRIDDFDDRLKERLEQPEFQDFFEDVTFEAAKAKQEERLKVIANMLTSGVNSDAKIAEIKRCLGVISRLDDLDLLILIQLRDKKAAVSEIHEHHIDERGFHIFNYFTFSECKAIASAWLGDNTQEDLYVEAHVISSIKRLTEETIIAPDLQETGSKERCFYHKTYFGDVIVSYLLDSV